MLAADDVRETPADKFAELSKLVGGFTLDVCATHANTKCAKFYDEALNGLAQPWRGERCFCNPPFSDIGAWVAKAWQASDAELVVMLVPATRTEQPWWQKLVEPYRDGRASLVPGWVLSTSFCAGRWHFLKDGAPIIDSKTGRRSSPKFGCVTLTWRHV
jgi:phage N-6-adenine-methyltransferase